MSATPSPTPLSALPDSDRRTVEEIRANIEHEVVRSGDEALQVIRRSERTRLLAILDRVARENERLRAALSCFVSAQDSYDYARRERARVEVKTTKNWPRDLSPAERAALGRQCEEDMAPIVKATKIEVDTKAEFDAALIALRTIANKETIR